MRWIRSYHLSVHSTIGGGDTSQNIPNLTEWKIPPTVIPPPPTPLSATIRTVWRVESGPIWCAESARRIHLSIALVVVEIQAKTSPICKSEKFRPLLFHPLYHHFQLQSEERGRWGLDLFDALNLPVASICPLLNWWQSYNRNAHRWKFRPDGSRCICVCVCVCVIGANICMYWRNSEK